MANFQVPLEGQFAKFILSGDRATSGKLGGDDDEHRGGGRVEKVGLEHISSIIPRVVRVIDCGDCDRDFDDAS